MLIFSFEYKITFSMPTMFPIKSNGDNTNTQFSKKEYGVIQDSFKLIFFLKHKIQVNRKLHVFLLCP